MAKKKEIKLTRTAGETVESGDVNFSYNNVLIGSLSDSGSAVLKTENTVVKHDIEVEYTKPTAGISLPEISGSYPDDITIRGGTKGVMLYYGTNNKIISNITAFTKQYLVPEYAPRDGIYTADIFISSDTDTLNVTINNTTVPFNTNGYSYRYSSATYPEGFTVVVTNK